MKRRIFALIMIVIAIFAQVQPIYAEERFQGDMIDWLFEMAKRNNSVAQAKYIKDKANEFTNGDKDLINFADGLVKDYLNNAQYNNDTARDAIKNTLFGLPKETQDNLTNVYNTYKNTDIILAPEIQAELNINAFNKSILNNNVQITDQRKPTAPLLADVMTANDFRNYVQQGYGYDHATASVNAYVANRSTIHTIAEQYRYIYMFEYQYTKVTPSYNEGNVYRDGYEFGYIGSNVDIEIVQYPYMYNKKSDKKYLITYMGSKLGGNTSAPAVIAVNNNESGWATGELAAKKSIYPTNDWSIEYNGSLTQYTKFQIGADSWPNTLASITPYANLNVRKIQVIASTVQNNYNMIQNTYNNVKNNVYNYDTINNYYNDECIPAQNPTNNYYEYTTNQTLEGAQHEINLEYTKVVNEYITNNTYGGNTSNVTYITNVTQIPNYQPPATPTPAPTPSPTPEPETPTPSPSPEPGEPTPSPSPEPGTPTPTLKPPIDGDDSIGDGFLEWLADKLGWALDTLLKILAWIAEKIKDFILWLFVPSDDFWQSEYDGLKKMLQAKLPYEKYINAINQLENVGAASAMSTRAGASGFEDMSFTIMGVPITFAWARYVNDYLPTIQAWIRGLFYLLLAYYNYRQIMYLIRGTTYSSIGNAHASAKKESE